MEWRRVVGIFAMMVWVVSMCWESLALADKKFCTKEESQSAEAVAATADSWAQLKEQVDRYSHCDDGAIAEGFSESVSRLLADQWRDIRQLGEIVMTQSEFRMFVLRHIDETVPNERLERIGENARERCPQGLEDLCREIESRVVQVLPRVHSPCRYFYPATGFRAGSKGRPVRSTPLGFLPSPQHGLVGHAVN